MEANRKSQIYKHAQNLFRERGYTGTSMRDLAKAVGIEAASLYSHIPSKAYLLEEICFRLSRQFHLGIADINPKLNPIDKIKAAIHMHMDVIANNLDASAVFLHDWRFLDDPKLQEFISKRRDYQKYFEEIVNEGIEKGVFTDCEPKLFLNHMFSAMNWTYEWFRQDSGKTVSDLSDEIYNIFFKGILKR